MSCWVDFHLLPSIPQCFWCVSAIFLRCRCCAPLCLRWAPRALSCVRCVSVAVLRWAPLSSVELRWAPVVLRWAPGELRWAAAELRWAPPELRWAPLSSVELRWAPLSSAELRWAPLSFRCASVVPPLCLRCASAVPTLCSRCAPLSSAELRWAPLSSAELRWAPPCFRCASVVPPLRLRHVSVVLPLFSAVPGPGGKILESTLPPWRPSSLKGNFHPGASCFRNAFFGQATSFFGDLFWGARVIHFAGKLVKICLCVFLLINLAVLRRSLPIPDNKSLCAGLCDFRSETWSAKLLGRL